MPEIQGEAKTIQRLLSGEKYTIDYYQREYKWETKQVRELIDDLANKFLEDHDPAHERGEVENYGHYFLGSIIVSRKDNQRFLIDGQQRLTSLTLLLIFLNNLQRGRPDAVNIADLIFSERYSKKSFNIQVEERIACMEALFNNKPFDEVDQPESVQNIIARYRDIEKYFPHGQGASTSDDTASQNLTGESLPFFINWLQENVHLVEITAFSDDDAYTIFETMNDRGLSLSLIDMLKGYLLANILDGKQKISANRLWKERVTELREMGKDVDSDFFKAWLRSQYAESIRERKRNAQQEDFDRIGTEFHRWVRDHEKVIGLQGSDSFVRFVERDFSFYSRCYLHLMEASTQPLPQLEPIFYISQLGFTMQYQLLLSPLILGDAKDIVQRKFRIVASYLDILLNRRLWNFRSIAYSTMQYAMFVVMRDIRHKDPDDLARGLYQRLVESNETFASNDRLRLHQQNGIHLQHILARLTDYVEQQSDIPSHYLDYTTGKGNKRFEIEHIWANKPDRYADEFPSVADFTEYRNRIGDLLLLQKSFNASYGALPYEEKLQHYNSQNLLARSLHPQCYEHNPGFLRFMQESGLPFRAYTTFKKAELDERQELYRRIAEMVWNPQRVLDEAAR